MNIIPMKKEHADEVISMMNVFYHSPAVYTDGSDEIYRADVENCINDSPYLEGYVFEEEGIILGYSMLAKSFSTEFGKPCIWIEDIYLKPDYRDRGIGSKFISFVSEKYSEAILRLEVEEENERAVHVYQKSGFTKLPYVEMKK